MPAADFNPDDYRMSFGEHLDELRTRLIRGLLGVVVIAGGTFYFGKDIVWWLVQPLTQAQNRLGLPEGTISTSVLSPFAVFMKVSIISALIIGAPWLLYQIWKFVEAGLYSHERKFVIILIPFSTAMTVLGVLFMYYILLPISIAFLLFFASSYSASGGEKPSFIDTVKAVSPWGEDEGVKPPTAVDDPDPVDLTRFVVPQLEGDPEEPRPGQMWINTKDNRLRIYFGQRTHVVSQLGGSIVQPMIDINTYIGFVMFMGLGIAIGFQLPVLMLVAGWSGAVNPVWLKNYRKHCLFVCFVLGAFLTPADPLSMMILAVPLYLLFEFGLILMGMTYKEPTWGDEEGDNDGVNQP